MARVLRIGSYLATFLLVACLVALVVGLLMGARPETFAVLGIEEPEKSGFVVALVAGIGAIACAILGRVLELVRSSLGGQDNTEPQ